MAAAKLLRRSLAALTVAGLGLAGAPLLGSASASSDVALVSTYPAFNGSVVSGGETLKATFNQAVSQDKNVSWFKVFTYDGTSVGNQVAGSYDFTSSKQGGATDTVTFTGSLGVAGKAEEYQAQVRARSADGKSSTGKSFFFWVDPRAPQANGPKSINSGNEKVVTFTGTAAPGLTVHVDILPSNNTSPSAPPAVASGTATVATCASAPNCPWTVTIDASNLPDYDGYYWWAYAKDANASSPPTKLTPIPKATNTSVMPPNQVAASMRSNSPATLDLKACASDPRTTGSWKFDAIITDPEGHTIVVSDLPTTSSVSGCPLGFGLDTTKGPGVDVSKLDDGALTPTVSAVDTDPNGGVSSGASGTAATKAVGLDLDFASSSLATPSNPTVTFPTAAAQVIQSPTSIQLRFSEPVKPSFTDSASGPPKTYGTSVCVLDRTTSACIPTGVPTISSDGFTMTVPISGQLNDAFSPYTISVQTYEKNLCPDRTLQNSNGWRCYTLYTRPTGTTHDGTAPATDPSAIGPVTVRQSIEPSSAPFKFSLDDVPPAVNFATFSPMDITGANNTKASVGGTTDRDTTQVQVVIRSSAGGTPVIVDVPVTPSSEATSLPWAATNVNLSGVPDGTLNVTATATDVAGNRTPRSVTLKPSPVLRAHPSTLTEHTSAKTVDYGQAIRLYGRLTDTYGRYGLGGARLTIRPRFDSGQFGAELITPTNRYGYWSRTLKPAHNATYWVFYAGATTAPLHGAVTTHTARTAVKVRIRFSSPSYGAHVGSRVRLNGQVSPNKNGVYVYFYRHTAHRSFYLGRARLGRSSMWSFTVSLPGGTDYVFAQIDQTRGNLGNRTALFKLVR